MNWADLNTGTNNTVNDMVFTDSNTGYLLGAGAMILKTTNGGSITSIEPVNNIIPQKFSLSQNYPNPFNPVTKIKFSIQVTENVSLTIYDVLGRKITTLVNSELQPGNYEVNFDAGKYSSGIYFFTLSAGSFSETKKMLMVK